MFSCLIPSCGVVKYLLMLLFCKDSLITIVCAVHILTADHSGVDEDS